MPNVFQYCCIIVTIRPFIYTWIDWLEFDAPNLIRKFVVVPTYIILISSSLFLFVYFHLLVSFIPFPHPFPILFLVPYSLSKQAKIAKILLIFHCIWFTRGFDSSNIHCQSSIDLYALASYTASPSSCWAYVCSLQPTVNRSYHFAPATCRHIVVVMHMIYVVKRFKA